MKLHKINNKRNERLFKRLTESFDQADTDETIDEGPFDAIKDKVGDLADKVTGKKRGSAAGGKGFNAHGESQEDGYDQKIFGAWNARAGAAAGIYQSLVDPNGSFFKAIANRSISPQKAKPIDFAKAFSSMMKKNVHLRGMMKDWSKGRADKLYNLLSPNQVKGLNQILNSKNKHQGDAEKTVGALFYNKLANILNDMRIGEVEYQEYLSNSEGIRTALRTLAKSMLSPQKGRSGERAWKEFTRGANSELGFELPAAAAITAAELVAEEFEERRQAGTLEEETTNEENNVKYNKLYENWNKHLEEEAELSDEGSEEVTEGDPASAIERFLGFRLEPGQTLSGELKRAFKDWNAERLRKNDAELEKTFDVSPWDSISENTEEKLK